MAGQLTIDTLKASSGVLATQNGMTGIAKAWVYFTGSGSASISSSFNVSSVVRNATGDYTVNFTTSMADANYAWSGTMRDTNASGVGFCGVFQNSNAAQIKTTAAIRFYTGYSGAAIDAANASVIIHGN